jgi:hypothetical protein
MGMFDAELRAAAVSMATFCAARPSGLAWFSYIGAVRVAAEVAGEAVGHTFAVQATCQRL